MANLPNIPARELYEVRSDSPAAPASGARAEAPASPDTGNAGPRKLVRPTLPPRALRDSGHSVRGESPLLAHQATLATTAAEDASHAEAFYFQKQMQMQTLMTFVLEDGEQIEGYIEWYDRHAIKVRNGSRTLIYKSSIKYLYKSGENYGQ